MKANWARILLKFTLADAVSYKNKLIGMCIGPDFLFCQIGKKKITFEKQEADLFLGSNVITLVDTTVEAHSFALWNKAN